MIGEEPLCLRPEVLDLALFAKAMVEELSRRRNAPDWYEGEGRMISLFDALAARLAAVGIIATPAGNNGRWYLVTEFPQSIDVERLRKAHEEYDSYRAEFVLKLKEQKKD